MRTFLLALAVLAATARVFAAPVEADPNQEYPVTPEVGPWMICVNSYRGDQAKQLARELALEVRSRYNMPAYVFNKGEEERRKQKEQVDKIRQFTTDVPHARIRVVRIEDQCAVLVGGYKDMDNARRALDQVKRWKPPENKRLMDFLTEIGGGGSPAKGPADKPKAAIKGAYVNPFVSSFVVRNPTIPAEPKPDPGQADDLLRKLNGGRPYNLLKCSRPWTLAIKEFSGASAIQPAKASSSFLEMLGFGNKAGEVLNAGALQAEEVARVLREMKFEAYVLHTRYSSVVSVGNFDRADDPHLQQLQRKLANLKLGTIEFFAQPMPMQVPQS